MAIKIYQSQIRPTEEIGAVQTTPGMRVSMETASALGAARMRRVPEAGVSGTAITRLCKQTCKSATMGR